MKKNKKYILIIIIVIIVILSFVMIVTRNKKTVCTSVNNQIELSTRGNKLYVIGNYNIDPKEEIIDNLLERYPDSISYDKDNNTLKYYFIYDSSNQELLNFMNIDYLLDANYKKVKSNLESKNYKCE